METKYTVTIVFSNEGAHSRTFDNLTSAVAYAQEAKEDSGIAKIMIYELALHYTGYSAEDIVASTVLSIWEKTDSGWNYGFR